MLNNTLQIINQMFEKLNFASKSRSTLSPLKIPNIKFFWEKNGKYKKDVYYIHPKTVNSIHIYIFAKYIKIKWKNVSIGHKCRHYHLE